MSRTATLFCLFGFAAFLVAQTPQYQNQYPNQSGQHPQNQIGQGQQPIGQGQQQLSQDQKFLMAAINGGNYEIQSSRMALMRSQDENVKKIAQQLIDDHTKASQELMQIVQNKRMPMPPSQQLDPIHSAMMQKLSMEQGKDFDDCFMEQQAIAHVAAVMCFTKESKKGQDNELKQFASKTLPKLKEHKEVVMNACNNFLESGTYQSMKHDIRENKNDK